MLGVRLVFWKNVQSDLNGYLKNCFSVALEAMELLQDLPHLVELYLDLEGSDFTKDQINRSDLIAS